MIQQMVIYARNNQVTPTLQDEMQKKVFHPLELLELNDMNRNELKYLMMFCDIRVVDGLPVVAMEDDELRMAYLIWRSLGQEERKAKRKNTRRKIRKVARVISHHIERGVLR